MISSFFETFIKMIGSIYPFFRSINNTVGTLLGAMVTYRIAYVIIGIFFTRKFKPAKKKHKYAIVIAARNEKNVIGNLLDSIHMQDYPSDLITIFVVADNCTDNTAEIARSKGAIVYERFDNLHKTKGFALEYLFDCIERDYGRMSYEGYFVFDADNLLKKDYISKMNDAFDSGEKMVTSYRNTKNFDENWITMSFALHWYRSIRMNHRARSFLRLATNIQGTGYLFASEVVQDGWHYTSLTEDRGLTADAVSQGYRISYQDAAEFYDEQSPNWKVAYNQKLRWSKGLLINFKESGFKLFINIFFGRKFTKVKWSKEEEQKRPWWKKILIGIKDRFIMYDTFMHLLPTNVINLFRWILVVLILRSCYTYTYGLTNINFFAGGTVLAQVLRHFFDIRINITPGISALWQTFLIGIWARLFFRIGLYLKNMITPYYILFLERKRIKKVPFHKIIGFSILWPIFDIVGRYTTYIALFKKIEWKPVPHNSKITINDINTKWGFNMEKIILIKYGELTTKKENRNMFINILYENIKNSLKGIDYKITKNRVRMFITPKSDYDFELIINKLTKIFGIHSIVICYKVNTNIESIKENALTLAQNTNFQTFKVETNRSYKEFPLTSLEVSKEVGAYILKNMDGISVSVHNPDYELKIEIRNDYTYLYSKEIKGVGGYPVGVQGKGLLMLSGGIDSPVALYLALKRGIKVECIYFESPPHTSLQAKNKVKKLVEILTKYHPHIKLHIVKFTEIQEEIYKNIDPSYMITIMRRMMYRISEKVAKKNKCLAIINGESVGQVASQTLTSMNVINNVTTYPIIRPVACMDKLEIIELSKHIGTYDTSILPYEDCCTIFLPKHPVINPKLEKCLKYEKTFDYDKLIDEAIDNMETVKLDNHIDTLDL